MPIRERLERANRNRGARLFLIIVLAVPGLFLAAIVARNIFGDKCGGSRIQEEINNLRFIVGLIFAGPDREIPMRDGAFDPYAFVRRGDVAREDYKFFRSARSGTGPTDEEIERGDYTNFPWERYRGDGKPPGRFPLLWEKEPDERGRRVAGFSDGSSELCRSERLAIRILVGCVASTGKIRMKDGQFDPYAFVREGLVPASLFRRGSGDSPTDEEIERGDYTNFPWERYRGDGKLEGPPFPLLWSKVPDDDGKRRAGFSDGTCGPLPGGR